MPDPAWGQAACHGCGKRCCATCEGAGFQPAPLCIYCTHVKGGGGELTLPPTTLRALSKQCIGQFIEVACKTEEAWSWQRATLLVRPACATCPCG